MRRGAQELAPAAAALDSQFDLLMATDMLDLAAFLALTRPRFATTPALCYFHENQFTYPRLRGTKFNSWFGQINYLSACAADYVAFNSAFHRDDFLAALQTVAEAPNGWLVDEFIRGIGAKSAVLPVGVELSWLDEHRVMRPADALPLILWNHRWEFDKAPDMFARAIARLADEGLAFRLALAGEPGPNPAPELEDLIATMPERIDQCGYLTSREEYARALWESDIVVSTSRHEFFGVGMVEALYCECVPVAPRRYNYPALVPEGWHEPCLFDDQDSLVARLTALIGGRLPRDGAGRQSAERFRWETVITAWDEALEAMACRHINRE